MRSRPHPGAWILVAALLSAAALAGGEPGFSRSVTQELAARYAGLFGQGARGRLAGWQALARRASEPAVVRVRMASDDDVLALVNRFYNGVPSLTDREHWNADDYWATPAETLASNGADCEDYAIGKYFLLKELGVPIVRLRLVYVRAERAGGAHMVLAYYPQGGAEPLILDNIEGGIRPASERPDLQPVYTFNDEVLQLAQGSGANVRLRPDSNRQWALLLAKLQDELTF